MPSLAARPEPGWISPTVPNGSATATPVEMSLRTPCQGEINSAAQASAGVTRLSVGRRLDAFIDRHLMWEARSLDPPPDSNRRPFACKAKALGTYVLFPPLLTSWHVDRSELPAPDRGSAAHGPSQRRPTPLMCPATKGNLPATKFRTRAATTSAKKLLNDQWAGERVAREVLFRTQLDLRH